MTASKSTKPTLETCAELVRAAKTQMDLHRDCGDEDAFDCARTAYLRAHESARKHGHSADAIRAYLCPAIAK